MADVKISALPAATTPLSGTEILPIVQGGVTTQVSVSNLTAARTVAASTINVDANTASAAVRITQTGAGNALVVEDSASTDATPFVVAADGRVFVGSTTGYSGVFNQAFLQAHAVGGNGAVDALRYSADVFGPDVGFLKSRSATTGTQAIVSSGDAVGTLRFAGSDGVAFIQAANISAAVDGTPGTNDMPGRLVFGTTAVGASTPTERMRITSGGRVSIGNNPSPVALLQSTVSDGTFGFFVTGATRAVRFVPSSTAMSIEGTDNTGSASFQPLIIGGSDLRFATNNTERMRVTSAGTVGIGTTDTNGGLLLVSSDSFTGSTISAHAASANPFLVLRRSNGTMAAPTAVTIGMSAGTLDWRAYDGATYVRAASIEAFVDGTPGTNDMPGRLVFSTTADGASTPLERMRITNLGNVCIGTGAAGTSAEEVLAIGTGVAPTTGPADTIQIYSTDLSAGNTMLSIYTEGTSVNANTTAAATHRIAVRINGTVYYLLANTAA